MNKQQFINTLKQKLTNINKKDKEEALLYYSEIIDDLIEDNRTEEEAIRELGDIDKIVEKIYENSSTEKNRSNIVQMILLTPCLFILAIIVYSLFISLYSIILSLYVASFSFILLFVTYLVDSLVNFSLDMNYAIFELGVSIAASGLTVTTFIASNSLFKLTNKGIKKFTLWIINIYKEVK